MARKALSRAETWSDACSRAMAEPSRAIVRIIAPALTLARRKRLSTAGFVVGTRIVCLVVHPELNFS
jgi:hypothetical protein